MSNASNHPDECECTLCREHRRPVLDTHGYVMMVGRHKGELITRIPVSYLKWLANTPDHREHELAKAEMARRGTVTPPMDVSGHAIDSASLRLRKIWHETALSPEEGLHAWLCRMAEAAWETKQPATDDSIIYQGIKFVFETDGIWPVLKTVMSAPKGRGGLTSEQVDARNRGLMWKPPIR